MSKSSFFAVDYLFSDKLLYMFEDELMDIQDGQNRYVIRRNSVRSDEIAANRQQRIDTIEQLIKQSNRYLLLHPRAKAETQTKKIEEKIKRFKLTKILSTNTNGRRIELVTDQEKLREISRLDGCYAMKTNLPKKTVSKKEIHDRYKDLAHE